METLGTVRQPLYESVASQIVALIDAGTYRSGEKIPSVRALSGQMRVSLSTVLEAYRLLEDRGRIEARPQSGYYVRPRTPERPEMAPAPTVADAVCPPSPCRLSISLHRNTSDPRMLPLGAALPNPAMLPLEKLSRVMARVVREDPVRSGAYDISPGCLPLRVQVARRALAAGVALTPDEIVTTGGSQEAMSLCLRAICRPGDTVAVETPTYYGILEAIGSLGLRALEIPCHPQDGLSVEALRFALDQTPVQACLFVSNFNNPLGCRIPDPRKREIVALLAARDIPLIEDDIYGDLAHSGERPGVFKAFDRTGGVLLCSSFSKTIAPGYRVGWVAPGRYQAEVEHLKMVSTLSTASPTQLAVAEFLASGGYDHHLRRIRRLYAAQCAQMAEAVGHWFPEGTRVTEPQGGFVLWVEMPPGTDCVALYHRALESGIAVAPGTIFSAQEKYRNCLRLNAAYWSPKIEGAMETLGRLARECRLDHA